MALCPEQLYSSVAAVAITVATSSTAVSHQGVAVTAAAAVVAPAAVQWQHSLQQRCDRSS
eukprot:20573-Heterococcus_DN1.PRE.3